MQYTIRNVPRRVEILLRRRAKQEKKSLNAVALEALKSGSGLTAAPTTYHDLDELAGTWQEDPAFEEALAAQDQIDVRLWR